MAWIWIASASLVLAFSSGTVSDAKRPGGSGTFDDANTHDTAVRPPGTVDDA